MSIPSADPAAQAAVRHELHPTLELIAYATGSVEHLSLVPASVERAWMKATPHQFAQRCLPLLIANQAGWFIVAHQEFEIWWTGGAAPEDLLVRQRIGTGPPMAMSHFGSGILTFSIPYLFRTPPGYNLLVRGPPNWPKDGVTALDGIVETDWATATFTMNWKVTRPLEPIVFAAGEPVAFIAPMRRGELESFAPRVAPLVDEPQLAAQHGAWADSRRSFNEALSERSDAPWQRDYFAGRDVAGDAAFERHQTKLNLKPFKPQG
ncbi:DUF6065 family protein [Chelatococcus reniformis]|uniref:Uncharacterized protein n=1 Tax=Chelatococcus reniformis TaxID=1494448 RepID=A0A916X8A5_9HYPH|nr:DUF6065 family protein [Chelatococcus reniformis]GGC53740.1 hypothetical protein GCM10010994_10920 [Chelatococcus reniformis]